MDLQELIDSLLAFSCSLPDYSVFDPDTRQEIKTTCQELIKAVPGSFLKVDDKKKIAGLLRRIKTSCLRIDLTLGSEISVTAQNDGTATQDDNKEAEINSRIADFGDIDEEYHENIPYYLQCSLSNRRLLCYDYKEESSACFLEQASIILTIICEKLQKINGF